MRLVKRVLDRVAAALLLVLLSPLLAAIALWIVLEGGRPAVVPSEEAVQGLPLLRAALSAH